MTDPDGDDLDLRGPGTSGADLGGIDLRRVWTGVAAEVWRRHPGAVERLATRLLRSPGLARALLTTPSLLLPWLISMVVVFGVGGLVNIFGGQQLVWLLAPGLAAVGIAYAYGPGIDPAWELACSMAVSDRMVLLVRAVGVFAVNAFLGLVVSAISYGVHVGWGTPGQRRGPGPGRHGHLRLAAADDRGLRPHPGGGRHQPVGQRGRPRRGARLGRHGARQRSDQRRLHRRRHRLHDLPALR